MALLELVGLCTNYGAIQALNGIELRVEKGEIVTLLGSNGAGKSTTLKTISGLLKPRAGQVWFNGSRIDGLAAHAVTTLGIGHVPEGRKIFPRLTVEENLEIGAYTNNSPSGIRQQKEYVFQLFPRLKERLSQKGGTLSGGEQQMLAIGRALMMQPKILLLDEPSMGLAPVIVEQIFRSIQSLNEAGLTVLLVEQNAFQALQLANRGYVLQTGSIVLSDRAEALQENELVREAYLGEA